MKIQNLLLVLVPIIAFFIVLQPLVHPGFFTIHDDEQIGRLYDLDKTVKAGHIPPRLAQDLGFGYDYPLFNFYPSFVYYIGELFHLVGFSYIDSTKAVIALGFTLSFLSMYLFSKEYIGKSGGVIAALLYTLAPYHSVDIYVRGALPEFFSFVFIPVLFLIYKKLADTKKIQFALVGSILITLLILTHNLVAMMTVLFVGPYILFLLFGSKQKKLFIFQVLTSVIIGILASSYFWLPSFLERKYTMVDLLTKELADYNIHFVCLKQFWNSPWGYGGSLLGCEDGLSFQIGKVHIIGSLIAFFLGIISFRKNKKIGTIVFVFFALFVFSLFIQLRLSRPLWDRVQTFWYIQFPWRFLIFSAFTSSFLTGAIFVWIKQKSIHMVLLVSLVLVSVVLYKDYFRPQTYLLSATDTSYTDPSVIGWRTSIMAFEYVPKGIKTKRSDVGTTIIDITKDQVAKGVFSIEKGTMDVTVLVDIPQEKRVVIRAKEDGVFRFNIFSFPGWEVTIDGKKTNYYDTNPLKLITIPVPKGTHTVVATLRDTPERTLGNSFSVIGIALLFGLSFFILVPKAKKRFLLHS